MHQISNVAVALSLVLLYAMPLFILVETLVESLMQDFAQDPIQAAHVQSIVYLEAERKETKESEIRTERIRLDSNICAGAY